MRILFVLKQIYNLGSALALYLYIFGIPDILKIFLALHDYYTDFWTFSLASPPIDEFYDFYYSILTFSYIALAFSTKLCIYYVYINLILKYIKDLSLGYAYANIHVGSWTILEI